MKLTAEQAAELEAIAGNGRPTDQTPIDELTDLLGLEAVGVRVIGAALFGRGSNATAHINLSADKRITLDPLGRFATPAKLTVEVAIQVGAAPPLKGPQVARVMVLLHEIAQHYDTLTEDDRGTDWGIGFLQAAQTIAVTMSDQRERWAAFDVLNRTDPVSAARELAASVAASSVVLEDGTSGIRYVRATWFAAYVRCLAGAGAAEQAARAMRRVGWDKPGTEGRIKATAPGRADSLQWAFWKVPAGWETR